MHRPIKRSLSILIITHAMLLHGQDLESLLEGQMDETTEFVSATFKATRVLNGHSIERRPEGQLDFRISHRFGRLNSGAYELFGIDQANIHLSLEYGIKDWIMVGLGRGTFEKTVDGFTKLSLLRQSRGVQVIPVSVSWMTGIYMNGLRWVDEERVNYFWQRLSYAHQLIIARKFSPGFSFQLTPSYLHQNLVESTDDPNDLFSIGAGGRLKLTKRISLNAEYYYIYRPDNKIFTTRIFNPFSLGFDIETGGHVFQIILTNSVAMRENGFLGHTTGQWRKGDIHLGFNISRVFQLKK